jgi:hypothetical protein
MAAVLVALSSLQNLWGFRELFARPGWQDVAVSVQTVESRGRDDDLMLRCFALGASAINLFQGLKLCACHATIVGDVISRVLSGYYARLRCGVEAATRVVMGAN